MKKLLLIVAAGLWVLPASAIQVDFGWECGETILGQYGDLFAYNVADPDPVYGGDYSLKIVDDSNGGTPQGFVAWVVGLTDGDEVTASIWRYDDTPGSSPSGRIWGHYTAVGGTIDSYTGSAGGNDDYGPGAGWDQTGWTWVFDSNLGESDGLVIEVRTYSNAGDTVWFDDLHIMAPDGVTIFLPEAELPSPVENSTWAAVKALYR